MRRQCSGRVDWVLREFCLHDGLGHETGCYRSILGRGIGRSCRSFRPQKRIGSGGDWAFVFRGGLRSGPLELGWQPRRRGGRRGRCPFLRGQNPRLLRFGRFVTFLLDWMVWR